MTLKVRKLIVRLRMWYARIRGHKEHKWNYEPSEWYMGKHNKKNKEKKMFGSNKEELKLKRFMVMCKSKTGTTFYHEKSFFTLEDADAYANLVRRQEDEQGNQFYLFEQSKHYGNGKDKDA